MKVNISKSLALFVRASIDEAREQEPRFSPIPALITQDQTGKSQHKIS